MIQLPTWMTMEEKIRHIDRDEPELADLLRDVSAEVPDLQRDIERLKGIEERLREQLYFAREAFGSIRYELGRVRGAKQAREAFEFVMAESCFEE